MRAARLVFFLMILSIPAIGQVQPPLYMDAKWNPVVRENALFYRLTDYTDSTFSAGTERNFYISGKPHSTYRYSSFYPLTKHGVQEEWFENGQRKTLAYYKENKLDSVFTEWYENGKKRMELNYSEGIFDGEVMTWHESGTLKRRDTYKAGKLVSGNCFAAGGQNSFYVPFEKEPDLTRLNRHISGKLKYPKQSKKNNVEGDVQMYFVVNEEGRIVKLRILRGVNEELNEEALRVMRTAPVVKPGLVDGSPYPYAFIIPIRFKLK